MVTNVDQQILGDVLTSDYENEYARRYCFPIHNTDEYPATISFRARKVIPPNISKQGFSNFRNSLVNTTETNLEFALPEALGVSGTQRGGTGDTYIQPSLTETKPQIRNVGKCKLFAPRAINFQDGVAYDEFSLGRIGGATSAVIENGASIGGAIGTGASQFFHSLTDLINFGGQGQDLARVAATRLAKFGGKEFEGGVKSALKTVLNPNKQILFKEVNIRQFSFTFKLIPKSKEEANQITQIIKFFRTELYPDDSIKIDIDGTDIPIGYKFPNHFDIEIRYRGEAVAHRILPSYLVNINTVYNPTGASFLADGNFIETEITLNFRESKTLSKLDIINGY